MADTVSPETRSRMMAAVKGKDTKPEMAIRRGLHARGFRFRKHDPGLPGTPDLVLPKWGAVVFVEGCFWHGHEGCRLARMPGTRTEFWKAKIQRNRSRDERSRLELDRLGWRHLTVWECATRGPAGAGQLAVDLVAIWLLSGGASGAVSRD